MPKIYCERENFICLSISILFIPFPPQQIKQSKYFCFIGKLFQLIQHDKKNTTKIDNENKNST